MWFEWIMIFAQLLFSLMPIILLPLGIVGLFKKLGYKLTIVPLFAGFAAIPSYFGLRGFLALIAIGEALGDIILFSALSWLAPSMESLPKMLMSKASSTISTATGISEMQVLIIEVRFIRCR